VAQPFTSNLTKLRRACHAGAIGEGGRLRPNPALAPGELDRDTVEAYKIKIAADEPLELPIVIVDDADTVIANVDGNHRLAACHELGYPCPAWTVPASALPPYIVPRSSLSPATLAQLDGDVLANYGNGQINLSALQRACRDCRFPLGEIKTSDVLPKLVVSPERVEHYKRQLRAGGPKIEPVIAIVGGPIVYLLDGHHRTRAHRELGHACVPAWLVPRGDEQAFMVAALAPSP
jgi:hypothetical protein